MNMDYCKFENTARDLRQCVDAYDIYSVGEDDDDGKLNRYESEGHRAIFRIAVELVNTFVDLPSDIMDMYEAEFGEYLSDDDG